MPTPVVTEVVFPKSQIDLYPAAAQQLYIETYKRSFVESAKGNSNQLSHDSVAARDAWDAVRRAFKEDPMTHKWRAIGEQTDTPTERGSLLRGFKRLFKR